MASALSTVRKERRTIWRLDVDLENARETLNPEVRFDCRAFRLLGDPERLVSVRFIRKPKKEDIKGWIRRCQSGGKTLNVDGTNVKCVFDCWLDVRRAHCRTSPPDACLYLQILLARIY